MRSALSSVATLLVGLTLASLLSPAVCQVSYSSWTKTVFPSLSSSSSSSPSLSSSASSTTVSFNSALNGAGVQGTPFNSVTGVAVSVSAATNLAYPFTSNTLNGRPFHDVDTGIDVMAGGIITFRMPTAASGGTGLWCYELGRSLAGSSACSGPAGYTFDYYSGSYQCVGTNPVGCGQSKCNNTMINGAWNSTDGRGTALSFTYARSGALMARVGGPGQSSQAANENANDPVGEYFSAFDHVDLCPTVITPMMGTSGYQNQYTSVNSGRLYLAIFRWNAYPQLANGSVNILIDYQSPLQVGVSSSALNGTTAGSAAHPVVLTQLTAGSALPGSTTLSTATPGTVTITGLLPVVNISISTSQTTWSNASGYTPQGGTNQVTNNGSNAQLGAYSGPWLSWALPPAAMLVSGFNGNAVGVDLSQMLSPIQFGFIFPATQTNMSLNPYWQQSALTASPTGTAPTQQRHCTCPVSSLLTLMLCLSRCCVVTCRYYPPASNDYDNDYDTYINVIEGGSITLSALASDVWCGQSDWSSSAPLVCSNGQGATQLPYVWNGCSGSWGGIYAIPPAWTPTSGNDNSGCNSDSDMAAPVNAVAYRISFDSTGMKNAGYLSTELHAGDYYTAFPNAPSNGLLSYTFTAPVSGRLYLSRQGPGGSASTWNGTIRVNASYTPPPNLQFGLTWSPSPNAVSQPYLFPAPTANTPAALSAAGVYNGRYLQIPDTFSSGQTVTATFWVYQSVFSGTLSSGSNTNAAHHSAASSLAAVLAVAVAALALAL